MREASDNKSLSIDEPDEHKDQAGHESEYAGHYALSAKPVAFSSRRTGKSGEEYLVKD